MLIEILKNKLQQPLPGKKAQYEMAHHLRYVDVPVPDDAKKAGVLLALYMKNGEWHTVLMKRGSRYKEDKHKGQVSFPGGKYELADKTLQNTALRESEEEVGLSSSSVTILGKLSELYIPVSNFLVYPFVGVVEGTPSFIPEEDEVDEIIECPISLLLEDEVRKKTNLTMGTGVRLKNVPYFDVQGHIVWGATCMILNEFSWILRGIGEM